jgi:hypothetical protein
MPCSRAREKGPKGKGAGKSFDGKGYGNNGYEQKGKAQGKGSGKTYDQKGAYDQKGKGKQKGKMVKFDGACRFCGKYGDMAKDCWTNPNMARVSNLDSDSSEVGSSVSNVKKEVNNVEMESNWVMMLQPLRAVMTRPVGNVGDFVYLLVDSGAYNHARPPNFAAREPIKANDDLLDQRGATTVNGQGSSSG